MPQKTQILRANINSFRFIPRDPRQSQSADSSGKASNTPIYALMTLCVARPLSPFELHALRVFDRLPAIFQVKLIDDLPHVVLDGMFG